MKEYRNLKIETTDKPLQLQGLAVVFNEVAKVGDFLEVIQPGAFEGVSFDDVVLLYNHDTDNLPLASTKNGSLSLWLSDVGLRFLATLPDTERGREVYEAIKTGLLRGCSFGFVVEKDSYIPDQNLRKIEKIKNIFEISLTAFPAYASSLVEVRNKLLNKGDNNNMDNNNNNDLNPSFLPSDGVPDFGDTVYSSPEYRSAFYKTLLDKPLTATEKAAYKQAMSDLETRSDSYITSGNAAAVIPTSTLNEIIRPDNGTTGILAVARAFSLPCGIAVPVSTPTSKAVFHAETSQAETENVDVTTVTFNGYELLKIFALSLKVKTMSIAGFESYLAEELRTSIFDALDCAMISGTGNGQPKGLLTAITWDNNNTVSASEKITYDDFTQAVSLLAPGYASGASFAMSAKTFYSQVLRACDGVGRPFYTLSPQEGTVQKILGLDVILDDNIEENLVLCGNFKKYLGYNLPGGIVIEKSEHAGFTKGVIMLRGIAVCDCAVLDKKAFTKIELAQG